MKSVLATSTLLAVLSVLAASLATAIGKYIKLYGRKIYTNSYSYTYSVNCCTYVYDVK